MNCLRNLFTGIDNKTHDIVRVIGGLVGVGGPFLAGWDVIVQHAHFDFQNYGIGCGALLAGVGAALGMKKDTEPKP
jgi:hypothetical protein